jgi:hypothetical protein
MMASLFALLTLAVALAMGGRRSWAYGVFAAALVLSVFWYHHHATSALAIQL